MIHKLIFRLRGAIRRFIRDKIQHAVQKIKEGLK